MAERLEALSESGPGESELNEMLEDVWQDIDRARQHTCADNTFTKDEVDDKLAQFLRKNSEYISAGVERYMKMLS